LKSKNEFACASMARFSTGSLFWPRGCPKSPSWSERRAPGAALKVRYTRSASGAGKMSSVQPFCTISAGLGPDSPLQLWKAVSSLPTASASGRTGSPWSASTFQVVMSALNGPPCGS
jgi:hypothetical protein